MHLPTALCCLLLSPAAGAGELEGGVDWPSFRGANGAGVAEGYETCVEWDVESGENVRWRVALPGMAHSSPVISGERLFVTTAVRREGDQELTVGLYGAIMPVEDESAYSFELHCLDKRSGELRWKRTSWEGVPRFKRHPKGSHAASTPACDGERVVAFYGTEGLFAYDLDGEPLWRRSFGDLDSGFFMVPPAQWGFASSPVLHDGRVLVQCDVQGQSFVAALDAATGEEVWRTNRDEVPTWSTPTVDVREGRAQVICNGFKHIGGYDLQTGAELWRLEGGGDIPVPTPVVARDLVFVTNAHGRMRPIFAIDVMAEGTLTMDPEETGALAWMSRNRGNYMQTPLVYGDEAYFCSDDGILTCFDAKTGEERYRERLGDGGKTGFTASGVAAEGKLYFCSEVGDVYVVAAGPSFELLAEGSLGEECMASAAVSEGVLYYRCREHLVAIGAKEREVESGANWPSFRGERACGVAEGFATAVRWSVPDGAGIAWRTAVPGLAHSSPVVHGDRVFVTTAVRLEGDEELSSLYGSKGYGAGDSVEDEGPHDFDVYCLDRATGEVRWKRTAHRGVPTTKRHPKSSHANSTPACDGERVVAFFGSEGLFAYDHDGELLWRRDLGVLDCGAPPLGSDLDTERYQWGFASSPVLRGDRVFVQCDVQGQSFVAALDARTGEDVWRTEREEEPTWCTPTVCEVSCGGGAQLVCNGYAHVGGYELETGAELWRLSGGGDVPVPTPVVAAGRIFLTSAHGRSNPLYALDARRASGELALAPEESAAVLWYEGRRGVYMQTPLVLGAELYVCSDGGTLGCYDAASGASIYRERLGAGETGFSASPVAADGRLYFTGESGEVHVVAAGREFELLAVNDLGEECLATPAISHGRLLFRTVGHLVAVESPDRQ